MLTPLFEPIPIEFPPEFDEWFYREWGVKNRLDRLRAPIELVRIGALLELTYLVRGAESDPVPFRDVIVPVALGGEHAGVVDCKTSLVKTRADVLERYLLQEHSTKRAWYQELGIEKVHHWTYRDSDLVLRPLFVFDVVSGAHIKVS